MISRRHGKRPRYVGQIHCLIGADGRYQRHVSFGDDLFGQVSRRTVGAADDEPHPTLEYAVGELPDCGFPRILRPGRYQPKRSSVQAALGIGLFDGHFGGSPHVAGQRIERVAGTEIPDRDFGDVERSRKVPARSGVFRGVLPH